MDIQSFSPKALQATRQIKIPEAIVLRIDDLVISLREQMNHLYVKYAQLKHWYILDEHSFVVNILASINNEQDAEYSLAYDAYEILKDSYHTPYEQLMTDIANLFVSFGKDVIKRIRHFGLYEQGYLPYQFKKWTMHDAVLVLNETATYHLHQ